MAGACTGVLKCLAGRGAYVLVSELEVWDFVVLGAAPAWETVLPGGRWITQERSNDELGRVSTCGGGASAGKYSRAVYMRRSRGASG